MPNFPTRWICAGTIAHDSAALFDDYTTKPGDYDELRLGGTEIRAHWRPFIDAIAQQDLGQMRNDIRRHLQENGVTYNVHGDPSGQPRDWQLDVVPLIISEEDWTRHRSGHPPTGRTAQAHVGRPLRPADARQARADSARTGLSPRRLPAPLREHRSRTPSSAHLCSRSWTGTRRTHVGAGRPHPGALGHGLCDRKPHGHGAGDERHVCRRSHPAPLHLFSRRSAPASMPSRPARLSRPRLPC